MAALRLFKSFIQVAFSPLVPAIETDPFTRQDGWMDGWREGGRKGGTDSGGNENISFLLPLFFFQDLGSFESREA